MPRVRSNLSRPNPREQETGFREGLRVRTQRRKPSSVLDSPFSQEVSQVHYYSFLAAAIVNEVVATMLLKLSDGLTKWWWAVASVFFYAIAGVLLSFVLKYMAVGLVYAVWAGVGITLVCIASVVFLGQRFDAAALGGVALIIAGVLLITLKSGVTFQ